MAIVTGSVPKHLDATAKTGFLHGMRAVELPYQRFTSVVNMTSATQQLVDLGASPSPTKSTGLMQVQTWAERELQVEPYDWEIVVSISGTAVNDDQTGNLRSRCVSAGSGFQKHLDERVFTVLNGGDSTTYGLCYDGQEFFDSDHADKGADYQTSQDNEGALAFSLDNFYDLLCRK